MRTDKLERIDSRLFNSLPANQQAEMVGGLQTILITNYTTFSPTGRDIGIDTVSDPAS